MAKWEVQVCRTSYANRTIEVEANSYEEASKKALVESRDHLYSEHDADYEVVDAWEKGAWKFKP
jgi:hypothetical protein